MNNYTYTSSINKEELYKKYDNILGSTVVNLFSLSKGETGIFLNNFNYRSKIHRVFLETAFLLNVMHNKKIYLNMPLIPFLYFKHILSRKRKENLFRLKDPKANGINIEEIARYEATSYNESLSIFDDIYDEYYKKIYKGR